MSVLIEPNLIVTLSGSEQAVTPSTYEYSFGRKVFLFSEINNSSAQSTINQLMALDDVSHQDITLFINSPGGSVSDGLAIIDTMETMHSDVRTVCIGLAASMAAVILAAGTKGKRFITPRAKVMIHQPLGGIQGQASDISKLCEEITKTKDSITEFLSERTGQSMERLTTDMDRDYWLNSGEAVVYGIVDRIMKGDEL